MWMRRKTFVWRKALFDLTVRLANKMEARWFPQPNPPSLGGKMLGFTQRSRNLGYPVISITSLRGGFYMGTIEYSNQWGRPKFSAHYEAVFDQQCIAEIYAAMRDFK